MIIHERFLNQRNLKTTTCNFRVDGKHFEIGGFRFIAPFTMTVWFYLKLKSNVTCGWWCIFKFTLVWTKNICQNETCVFSSEVWFLYLLHHPTLVPAFFCSEVRTPFPWWWGLSSCSSFSSGARVQSAATLINMSMMLGKKIKFSHRC